MSALTIKLRRDLWRIRTQVFSIAAVMAGGVMTVVALGGTATSLNQATRAYYTTGRFADVFATLTRAPDAVAAQLAAIPGINSVATRVVKDVRLDVPGLDMPALGRMVSLPVPGTGAVPLNVVHVTRGREVLPGSDKEVLVSGRFAEANRLRPGDTLTAIINERYVQLRIVGIGAAPDYLYEEPGNAFPSDARGFGILWTSHQLAAAATGMRGAFNDVALGLSANANRTSVIAAVDSILAPYGGRGAVARKDQLSDRVVSNELHQMGVMAFAFPVVFVAVAAFLVGSVVSRLIATEREQIAVLKAFGYTSTTVGLHYLAYAAAAVAVGIPLGVGIGIWVGRLYTGIYSDVLRIPGLQFRADWITIGGSIVIIFLAALSGALSAVRRVAMLPPAEALQPPAPARYRALPFDRIGSRLTLSMPVRMILRGLERQPRRAILGAMGVAAALAMMAGALSLYDATDNMIGLQFRVAQRQALSVQLVSSVPASMRTTFASLPGVTTVELVRVIPVRLRHDGRSRTVGLTALERNGKLHRLVDIDGQTHRLPPAGIVLSTRLAQILGIHTGDTVDADLLDRGTTRRVVVSALINELMSPNAYMDLAAAGKLVGDGDQINGAYLRLDGPPEPALFDRLREMPLVASVASRTAMVEQFDRMMARSFRISAVVVVIFASVIALGVVYNGARIALSERGRELASLRVLGFTNQEVGVMLLGEEAILTVAAVPLGWILGRAFASYLTYGFASENYQVPIVTRAATYAFATAVVLVASAFAGALMYRRSTRLDLVAVLKTRE